MYGHDSKPSRIYGYNARAPHEGGDLVDEQLGLARVYRNAKIARERDRRVQVEEAVASRFPELAALKAAWDAAEARRQEIEAAVTLRNQQARRRTGTAEDRKAVKDARQAANEAKAAYKPARKAAFEDPALKAALDEVDSRAKDDMKEIYAGRTDPRIGNLYWGTKLLVDQALSKIRTGAPPEFKRWNGEGAVAVQCQGGLPWTDALLGTSALVRVQIESLETRPTHNKRGQPIPMADPNSRRSRSPTRNSARAVVWVRVGSQGPGGRLPVWAKVRVHLHRHPPADSRIKWVYLRRTYTGFGPRWIVQFVLDNETEAAWAQPDRATEGVAGLDLGWRKVDGGLRVAFLADGSGATETIVLSDDHIAMWEHAQSLQAIRDRNFDAIRARLVEWFARAEALPVWGGRWKLMSLDRWKSPNRLAAVVNHWRDHRFPGDPEIFEVMEAWRKQDRHLHDWSREEVRKADDKRRHLYRAAAKRVAQRYQTIKIEKLDLTKLRRKAAAADEESGREAKHWMNVAAVGILRQYVREAVANVQEVLAVNTTKSCHECGTVNEFDAKANLFFTCRGCGHLWDQDHNAAMNLRDGEPVAVQEPAAP